MVWGVGALFALVWLAAATPASAQEEPGPFLYGAARLDEDSAPRAVDRFACDVAIDTGIFYTDTALEIPSTIHQNLSIAGDVSVRARYDVLGLELSTPEEYGHLSDPPAAIETVFGNPSGALFGVGDFTFAGVRGTIRAGLGAALPTTQWPMSCGAPGCDPGGGFFLQQALFLAAAQSGLWQNYRYRIGSSSPSYFVPIGLELWIDRVGYLAVDLLVTTQWLERRLDVELAAAVEGGFEASSFARFSVRFVAVGRASDGTDHSLRSDVRGAHGFELSSEPRVTLAFGPFFARLGVLVNLEGPWGVDGVIRTVSWWVWSARVSAGLRF